MTDHEACETPRAPMMWCAKPRGHEGLHETAEGTEFTPSGKIGFGRLGPDHARWVNALTEGEHPSEF